MDKEKNRLTSRYDTEERDLRRFYQMERRSRKAFDFTTALAVGLAVIFLAVLAVAMASIWGRS